MGFAAGGKALKKVDSFLVGLVFFPGEVVGEKWWGDWWP
jgi:hypothetical protein